MDMITLAMAKAYTDKKAGYVEPGKVFTYDGGEDAEFEVLDGIRTVLLSEDVFDLSKIKRIMCYIARTGQEIEFVADDFNPVDLGDGVKAVQVSSGGQVAPVVFAHPAGGLFGYAQEGFGYLSYIEFEETIHTIDPKFIPDEAKPKVIDLDAYATEGITIGAAILSMVNSGGGSTTLGSMSDFWAAVSGGKQIALKMNYDTRSYFNIYGATILRNTEDSALIVSFSALLYNAQMGIMDIKVSLSFVAPGRGVLVNVKVS